MAYQIDRYNNVILTIVEDGTIDQTTDLKFIGKNFAGYGEIQNENFLYLLENFNGANPPPRAISGQVWYDNANSKLKFYDGTKWRTTGGAEVATLEPTGLSSGDLWWDTANEQLYVWGGSSFILVGPQNAGEGITAMVSTTLQDVGGNPRAVILAYVNDSVIYIVSADEFTINSSNAIPGFDRVKKGLTLINTTLSTNGITSSDHYYWGTASNALRLGGVLADDYLRKSTPVFTQTANFADGGVTIGSGLDLKIYVDRNAGATQNHGVIQHDIGSSTNISFKVNDGLGQTVRPVTINSVGLVPSLDSTYRIGTATFKFLEVHAASFKGEADKAATLRYDSSKFAAGSTSATGDTVAVRTADGRIFASFFEGIATSAQYADLAEKYTTDQEYPVGTVMAVGGDAETRAAGVGDYVVGVVSDQPAYLMNSTAHGQALALKGRVPVRVVGPITKGQAVYPWENGVASSCVTNDIVGIALETNTDEGEKLIECVLKL